MTFLVSNSLYTFTINCVTTRAQKWLLGICFALFSSKQCIIIISSRKSCMAFFSCAFKKIIRNSTTPTFQEVGRVTRPFIFCRRHNNFSWYRFNHHLIDRFLVPRGIFTFFVNETERQLIAKLMLSNGKTLRVTFPLLWFTQFLLVSIQRA